MAKESEGLLFDISQYEVEPEPVTPYNCDRDIESEVAEMLGELKRLKERAELAAPKKQHRPDGTGHLFEKLYKRNGKEYWQLWFQVTIGSKKHTKYVRAHLEHRVKMLYHNGATAQEILEMLGVSGA